MSIIGDGIMLGAGGESASIVVTAPTGSTVTCTTPGGIVLTTKEVSGTWTFAKLKVYGNYTITATDVETTNSKSVLVDAADVYQVNMTTKFRYIRWRINEIALPEWGITQASEFIITDESLSIFPFPSGTTIQAPAGASGEGVYNLIDNTVDTKYCTTSASSPPWDIVFDLGQGNTIDLSVYKKYGYYTANDQPGRDPISWDISVSNDGNDWTQVDSQNGLSITQTRNILANIWGMKL